MSVDLYLGMKPIRLSILLILLSWGPVPKGLAANEPWVVGIAELHRLDLLPAFKKSVRVASVSSYDRTGGNDDGFSGKYSFVRKEPGGLVIADLKGSGVIYRFWTPTPTDDLVEFYFDGEAAPRIAVKFREIFTGKAPPFVSPLVGFGGGGFYSYVPLPFAKSCKVFVRAAKVQFYQIHYAIYPDDAPITTFDPKPSPEYLADQEKACARFSSAGTDISKWVVLAGCPLDVQRKAVSLEPGKAVTVFETDKPGRIAGIRITPASALAGKDRDLLLRITWDDDAKPAVCCPAGDFFGYAWGTPAMTSLLAGTADGMDYCYFPMPFDRSAKVELVWERDDWARRALLPRERAEGRPLEVKAEVVFAPVPRASDEGKFYAVWRRENPTTKGEPFTFVETQGRGHLVGVILQAQGMETGKTLFFEGDDETRIDGELVIHGTGSEDFFNGGWYDVPGRWEKRLSFPLSGCLGYYKHLGRTGAYRLMLTDAYAYRKGICQTIEHGGEGNGIPTDYVGVTFLYSEGRPTYEIAPPGSEARKVVDPKKAIFVTGWSVPIHAFPFQGATLTKKSEKLDKSEVRFLSLRTEDHDWFGSPFISVMCDLPAAGRYAISIEAVKGPAQAIVQLFQNEAPVGDPIDLYAPQREKAGPIPLGILPLAEGNNNIMLKLIGKNEKATGWGLDLISIVCERAE
jgi:hypothetical protein